MAHSPIPRLISRRRHRAHLQRGRAGIHPGSARAHRAGARPSHAWIAALAALVTLALASLGGCARWMGGGPGDEDPAPDGGAVPTADASPDGPLPDGGAPPDATACGAEPTVVTVGELPADDWQAVSLAACEAARHPGVGAAGQTRRLRLRQASCPLTVTVQDDHGVELVRGETTAGAPTVELPLTVEASGGLHVTVAATAPGQPPPQTASYEIRLDCEQGCDREATRYPIVLVHGAGGESYFGTSEYFFGVQSELEDRGYRVATPALPAYAHSADRAAALADALDDLLAETGAAKAHLIGHSQAGLDFRVLLSPQGFDYGARVATATSVSTPHQGLHPSYAGLSTYFGMDVTEAYVSGEFAQSYPDPPGVPRYSWAAATCGAYELTCLDTYDDEVVAAALASSYLSLRNLYGTDGHGGDNDAVVPVSTAAWGTFLGVLSADHWDVVGQVPLQRLGTFDHQAFYLSEARRLRGLEIDLGL